MATRTETCGNTEYTLAPMRAGQLRDLHVMRLESPTRTFMDDNLYTVACTLMNADKERGFPGKPFDEYIVCAENIPLTEYDEVLKLANSVSGFIVKAKKLGEEKATDQQ